MSLRKETVDALSEAIMDALNDKRLKSTTDVAKIIRVATLTDKQKLKLSDDIKNAEERVKELKALKAEVEAD